jgi:hypothetical protein
MSCVTYALRYLGLSTGTVLISLSFLTKAVPEHG